MTELLHRPIVFGKPVCEEIKYFGVRGRYPCASQIVWISCQTLAKMPSPNPIDHHSCSQRIISRRQPVCQSESPCTLLTRKRSGLHFPECLRSTQRSGGDSVTRRIRVAIDQNGVGLQDPLFPWFRWSTLSGIDRFTFDRFACVDIQGNGVSLVPLKVVS